MNVDFTQCFDRLHQHHTQCRTQQFTLHCAKMSAYSVQHIAYTHPLTALQNNNYQTYITEKQRLACILQIEFYQLHYKL